VRNTSHRVLRVVGKGSKLALVPLSIDRTVSGRTGRSC
jgi:hypothetical protein